MPLGAVLTPGWRVFVVRNRARRGAVAANDAESWRRVVAQPLGLIPDGFTQHVGERDAAPLGFLLENREIVVVGANGGSPDGHASDASTTLPSVSARGYIWLWRRNGEDVSETTRTVVVARRRFELKSGDVERRVGRVLPDPIKDHYVVINRRRYPPKQVVELVTGLERADFTTHQARRILMGLGFAAGRRARTEGGSGSLASADVQQPDGSDETPDRPKERASADALAPFVGLWVATQGPEVLVAAADPHEVVAWLAEHRREADSMFRVPTEAFEASGLAPL